MGSSIIKSISEHGSNMVCELLLGKLNVQQGVTRMDMDWESIKYNRFPQVIYKLNLGSRRVIFVENRNIVLVGLCL